MPKKNRTRKFAATKRMMSSKDPRIIQESGKPLDVQKVAALDKKKAEAGKEEIKQLPGQHSSMFFTYNTNLGPPFRVLIDTNFINFSIQNKLDIFESMMDCLLAKCTPYLTDCVIGELEKMGKTFRVALKIISDPRFQRLPCSHPGTYADDCIVRRVEQARCYIVATMDQDLKRRIRKIPGVPIMYILSHKYSVERLPLEALGAPRM